MVGMTLGELMSSGSDYGLGDWDPIVTAPKDGTHILVCCRNGDRHVAFWDAADHGGRWSVAGEFNVDPACWVELPDPPTAQPIKSPIADAPPEEQK